MKIATSTASKIHKAIKLLDQAGHDTIARSLREFFPRGANVALVDLRKAVMHIGSISAAEVRAEKLLEEVILEQEEDPHVRG